MNKRGISTQQYIWTFYIILAIIIAVLLVNYIRQEITGESYTQHVLSKKLGLTLDSAYASPGKLELNYNFNDTFIINSEKGLLTIKKEKIGSHGFYQISQTKDLDFNFESDTLKIISNKGSVLVDE